MQLQKQQNGSDDPPDPQYGCTRTGKHVIDGHAACTHHYNKPSPFGWND
jgi:hypothetical protein